MIGKLMIRAYRAPWERRIHFLAVQETAGPGRVAVGEPLTMREVNEGAAMTTDQSTFSLTDDAAQALMDELWTAGLRPTEGTGSAGALQATQNHLKDMQTTTYRLLQIIEHQQGL